MAKENLHCIGLYIFTLESNNPDWGIYQDLPVDRSLLCVAQSAG